MLEKDAEPRKLLRHLAEGILQFDPVPASWHIWIIHILKNFDQTAQRTGNQTEYNEMFERLQQVISARVIIARW
jgi:hypothetical protein